MRKAGVLSTFFVVVLLAVAVTGQAQQPKKIYRIGYLSPGNPTSEFTHSEAIRLALRELGYIEGQNIAFEYRYADGKRERFPEFAAELVRLKVDIIVVSGGNSPARALKNATKTIPIVMTGGSDPVEAGLVESLARPGGNVTGLTNLGRELGGKRLELFKEAIPTLARVAVLYDPATPNSVIEVKESLPVAARALQLTLQPLDVRAVDGFEPVFAAVSKWHADGLYVAGGEALMRGNENRIARFALGSRLRSVFTTRDAVEVGGLMSYGADEAESYRRVATYVDKIFER
jgi:putative tryptophan/tyrosine transport system substrate-binding protein